jgi:hypothetical protein
MLMRLNLRQFSRLYLVGLLVSIVFVIGSTVTPAQQIYAAGNTYYVAKNGSNSNPGTLSQPWLTIQKAANTIVAGDTVYVRSGVYNEYVYIGTSPPYTGKSGTATNPIVYKAYPGEYPIIDGTGLSNTGGYSLITVYNVSYCTIEGFELRNSSKHGIWAFGTYSNLTLRRMKIHDTQISGIYIEKGSNLLVDGCEVYNTNSIPVEEQVSLMGVTGFEIKDSIFHNSGKTALDFKQGCINGLVHNNEIYGNNDTTSGIYLDAGYGDRDTDNIKIYNNKIHDLIASAITIGSETSPHHAVTNVDIYNNLIYNNYTGFAVWPNPFTRTFRIINNTFYNNGSEIAVYGSDANAGVNLNCIIRNNILVHNGNYMIYFGSVTGGSPTVDHNQYYDSTGAYRFEPSTLIGTNYVKANPLFVNPPVDFRLQAGSQAINAGSATIAPLTDYAANPRPQDAAYDIGAYEYGSSASALAYINVSPSNPSVVAGGTQAYGGQGWDSSNIAIPGLTYTWRVTNSTAGSITQGGVFTAGTTPGFYPNVIQFVSGNVIGSASVTVTAQTYIQGDVNMDGSVNILDMILIGQHIGESGTPGWIREDVNPDGVINVLDSIIVGQKWTQ